MYNYIKYIINLCIYVIIYKYNRLVHVNSNGGVYAIK